MTRTLLANSETFQSLPHTLVGPGKWAPWPTLSDRPFWTGLDPELTAPILTAAEDDLGQPWPSLTATQFLEYARNGNRNRFQDAQFGRRRRLQAMVLAECIEDEGRFLDEIADGLWLICEETYWGLPAHVDAQAAGEGLPDVNEPTVDLFVAETAAFVSLVSYLLGDQLDAISPLIRPRIRTEVQRQILTPCLERDDFWWMGYTPKVVNNWNPWVVSNWLICILLIESQRDRQVRAVDKCLHCLDQFLDIYPADGGCDEGPGYWGRAGASVFECLETLKSATNGAIDLFGQDLIRNMGSYIHRVHIHENWFVNFADASARTVPGQNLVRRFGEAIGDPAMMAFGAYLRKWPTVQEKPLEKTLPALVYHEKLRATKPAAPYCRDAWWPDLQVMVARDSGGTHEGLFLAAKGGHNDESHNHNDIGQFLLYRDGRPILVDIGVETYRKQTFSVDRYSIWTMQSGFHNLPTVNGFDQAPGRDYCARDLVYAQDDERAQFSLEMAGAYPLEAGLKSWRREWVLQRCSHLTMTDTFELNESDGTLQLNLITPCQVDSGTDGVLVFSDSAGDHMLHATYPSNKLSASVERHAIEDAQIGKVWGDHLNRVVLTWNQAPAHGDWMIEFRK